MESKPKAKAVPQAFDVLIADDAGDSRQILIRLLNQFCRARVVEVRDGAQAITAYGKQKPDLVFLDLDMPEMDGLAALKEIRALDPEAMIVIVSGESSMKNVNEALALGAGAFIVKPYSARRIVEVVGKLEQRLGRTLLDKDEL